MTIERTPMYFGPENAPLFGWYHEPAEPGDLAFVICPPLGHESINSHRSVRHLADRLAEAGVPALRFDYHGTGDSAGEESDSGRVAAWMESIRDAINTLRTLSNCPRIGLLGIRLGATLAATVAAEQEIDSLIVWAPVRGRAYVREMKALYLTAGGEVSEVIEPGGFMMTAETQRDISALTLDTVPKAKRILVVDAKVPDKWPAEQIATPGLAEMMMVPHLAKIPEEAINQIVAWTRPRPAQRGEGGRAKRGRVRGEAQDYIESITPADNIFAITTEPTHPNESRPTILLANGGSTHHVGPNRLYVDMARALARAGFRSIRFDLPGLGDSDAEDPRWAGHPYQPDTWAHVKRFIAAIQQRPDERFVMMGLCSGAHASFHSALRLNGIPIIESVLINPLTFYWREGMSLEQPSAQQYAEWQWYMKSARSAERWKKLLRGQVSYRKIAKTISQRLGDIVRKRLHVGRSRNGADNLGRDVRSIMETGRNLTFVFARFDPGYDLLMFNAGAIVNRFRKQGRIKIWHIDDANHTFEPRHSREQMIGSLREHLSERYLKAEG